MRLFANLFEAVHEIRRDLYKSPILTSNRVQNLSTPGREVRESLGYSYSIPLNQVPRHPAALVTFGATHFPYWDAHRESIEAWLEAQLQERLNPLALTAQLPLVREALPQSDTIHPALASLKEGNHYSYTYGERLAGMKAAVIRALVLDPDTRRAYWPIYQPLDALRASELTRIPCSLGYHFLLRPHEPFGLKLHIVYLQRSANFQVFWLSDLWFAARILEDMLTTLRNEYEMDVAAGGISHMITSFHSFFDEEEEVF